MGAAYAEGMISYLESRGITVETVVHLSAADPTEFTASTTPNTYQMNIENDIVLEYKNMGEISFQITGIDRFGEIESSNLTPIGDYIDSHANTKLNTATWKQMTDLVNLNMVKINNTISTPFGTYSGFSNIYQSQNLTNGTEFNYLKIGGTTYNETYTNSEYTCPID